MFSMDTCAEMPWEGYHLTLGPHLLGSKGCWLHASCNKLSSPGRFAPAKISVEQRWSHKAFGQPGGLLSSLLTYGIEYRCLLLPSRPLPPSIQNSVSELEMKIPSFYVLPLYGSFSWTVKKVKNSWKKKVIFLLSILTTKAWMIHYMKDLLHSRIIGCNEPGCVCLILRWLNDRWDPQNVWIIKQSQSPCHLLLVSIIKFSCKSF